MTQLGAGELLGGGPRAFSKYETGAVKPSAAVNSLLRLLDADPGAIKTLRGDGPRLKPVARPLPFEVTGQHVAAVTERNLPRLLRLLLGAEAFAYGLPADGIQVTGNILLPMAGKTVALSGRTVQPAHRSSLPGFASSSRKPGRLRQQRQAARS